MRHPRGQHLSIRIPCPSPWHILLPQSHWYLAFTSQSINLNAIDSKGFVCLLGFHKTNGHNGALIVRQPIENEPDSDLYSEDRPTHVLVLTDYMHDYAETFFPGLPTREPGIAPYSFLINGLGRWRNVRKILLGYTGTLAIDREEVDP